MFNPLMYTVYGLACPRSWLVLFVLCCIMYRIGCASMCVAWLRGDMGLSLIAGLYALCCV